MRRRTTPHPAGGWGARPAHRRPRPAQPGPLDPGVDLLQGARARLAGQAPPGPRAGTVQHQRCLQALQQEGDPVPRSTAPRGEGEMAERAATGALERLRGVGPRPRRWCARRRPRGPGVSAAAGGGGGRGGHARHRAAGGAARRLPSALGPSDGGSPMLTRLREAVAAGVFFAIDPDAHAPAGWTGRSSAAPAPRSVACRPTAINTWSAEGCSRGSGRGGRRSRPAGHRRRLVRYRSVAAGPHRDGQIGLDVPRRLPAVPADDAPLRAAGRPCRRRRATGCPAVPHRPRPGSFAHARSAGFGRESTLLCLICLWHHGWIACDAAG